MSNNVFNSIIERFYETELKELMEKDNTDIYDIVVQKAYKDTQRILHGIAEFEEEKMKILSLISNGLQNYIKKEREATGFNAVHECLCGLWADNENLKEEFRSYGKAQKIINMSFKYLYTSIYVKNKKDENLSKFNDCHFTLDSYTLRWLNGCKIEGKPICLNADTSWSKLDFDNYKEIQAYANECVKKKFPGYNCMTAEFIVWECVKLYDALRVWAVVEKMENNDRFIETAKGLFKNDSNVSLSGFMDGIKEEYEKMGR